MFVGLSHILTLRVAWILISLGWLLLILEVLIRFKKERTVFQIKPAKHTWFTVLMAKFLITNLLFTLLNNSLVPPTEYDELAYHLAIPKLFIKNQAGIVVPSMMPSHYPLGAEMLYTISLLVSTELVAKLITWWCYLLTCIS